MKLNEWLPYSHGSDITHIMYGLIDENSEKSGTKFRVKFSEGVVSKWYYPPKEE